MDFRRGSISPVIIVDFCKSRNMVTNQVHSFILPFPIDISPCAHLHWLPFRPYISLYLRWNITQRLRPQSVNISNQKFVDQKGIKAPSNTKPCFLSLPNPHHFIYLTIRSQNPTTLSNLSILLVNTDYSSCHKRWATQRKIDPDNQ